jgi:hypothetical protein
MRVALLALTVLAGLTVGGSTAEAQLWKPAKKPTVTVAPTRPAAAKPARAKPARRTARPSRPAARRPVARDEPRDRDGDRADGMAEFDNAPVIVVERPGRGER